MCRWSHSPYGPRPPGGFSQAVSASLTAVVLVQQTIRWDGPAAYRTVVSIGHRCLPRRPHGCDTIVTWSRQDVELIDSWVCCALRSAIGASVHRHPARPREAERHPARAALGMRRVLLSSPRGRYLQLPPDSLPADEPLPLDLFRAAGMAGAVPACWECTRCRHVAIV